MKFQFSRKITVICTVLALLMLRASYWQYTRYNEKIAYIAELNQRIREPITTLDDALTQAQGDWKSLINRRVRVDGSWDYEHEMVLRNRMRDGVMGGFVLTPLTGEHRNLLVSRGFIPMQNLERTARKQYQTETPSSLVVLLKDSSERKLFAPKDPPSGVNHPWVDHWLRVDLTSMQKQLPYNIAPLYGERMPEGEEVISEKDLLITSSNRDQILFLPGAGDNLPSIQGVDKNKYPIPTYDTVVPPGRHYSYIFEWAIMALMTIAMGAILQLKRH